MLFLPATAHYSRDNAAACGWRLPQPCVRRHDPYLASAVPVAAPPAPPQQQQQQQQRCRYEPYALDGAGVGVVPCSTRNTPARCQPPLPAAAPPSSAVETRLSCPSDGEPSCHSTAGADTGSESADDGAAVPHTKKGDEGKSKKKKKKKKGRKLCDAVFEVCCPYRQCARYHLDACGVRSGGTAQKSRLGNMRLTEEQVDLVDAWVDGILSRMEASGDAGELAAEVAVKRVVRLLPVLSTLPPLGALKRAKAKIIREASMLPLASIRSHTISILYHLVMMSV